LCHTIDEKAAHARGVFLGRENTVHRRRQTKGQDEPRNHSPDIFGAGIWVSGSCYMSPVVPQRTQHRNKDAGSHCQQDPQNGDSQFCYLRIRLACPDTLRRRHARCDLFAELAPGARALVSRTSSRRRLRARECSSTVKIRGKERDDREDRDR